MIFYLTNIALDIVSGTIFWTIKQSTLGIYNLVFVSSGKKNDLTIKDINIDDKIGELIKKNEIQEEKIIELKKSIDYLSKMIIENYIA
tara:strand:+ start:79 stop:342 length:264 start_codon:yes stop_codon:yes gene_type:complete